MFVSDFFADDGKIILQVAGFTGAAVSSLTTGNLGDVQYYNAQSFTLSSTTTITGAIFKLNANNGSPTGTMTIRIETNNAGSPSGTLANANLTIAAPAVASSVNTGVFAIAASIPAGTYYMVLRPTTLQTTNNYFTTAQNQTNPYSGGNEFLNTDGVWSSDAGSDNYFAIMGYIT